MEAGLEVRIPLASRRLRTLAELKDAGIPTSAFIGLPGGHGSGRHGLQDVAQHNNQCGPAPIEQREHSTCAVSRSGYTATISSSPVRSARVPEAPTGRWT